MPHNLAALQNDWQTALLHPDGQSTGLTPQTAARFELYQRNVMLSLTEVLIETFPVTMMLVSEESFRQLVAPFIRSHPPRQPVLSAYGADFPSFIAAHPVINQVPYLADVARLEWQRVATYHAVQSASLSLAEFAQNLNEGRTTLAPQPHVQLWQGQYNTVAIWRAHQSEVPDLSHINPAPAGYAALLYRHESHAVIDPLSDDERLFWLTLLDGHDYAEAMADAPNMLNNLPAFQMRLADWFANNLFTNEDKNYD